MLIQMLKQKLSRFFNDDEGATMIEYGLIVALVSVVAIVALAALGTNLSALYTAIDGQITTALATL